MYIHSNLVMSAGYMNSCCDSSKIDPVSSTCSKCRESSKWQQMLSYHMDIMFLNLSFLLCSLTRVGPHSSAWRGIFLAFVLARGSEMGHQLPLLFRVYNHETHAKTPDSFIVFVVMRGVKCHGHNSSLDVTFHFVLFNTVVMETWQASYREIESFQKN